jgi:hypothetical protein
MGAGSVVVVVVVVVVVAPDGTFGGAFGGSPEKDPS